jgi:negative regulator of flagellin synthesis FlgM
VQLGKIDDLVVAAPVVDTQRVEQVKQAISDGTYEVNAQKVADKLMQFESILKSGN